MIIEITDFYFHDGHDQADRTISIKLFSVRVL